MTQAQSARAQDANQGGSSVVNPTQFNSEGSGDDAIDRFYGEFNDRIPIVVPKYHGIEPDLALHYHSSDGNGFVGEGWSIAGLSVIQRASPGRGAPTWTSSDIYLLDGQPLVPCAPGSVSPSCTTGGTHSTEIENYSRIAFNSSANTWTLTKKDGIKSTFSAVYGVAPGTYRWGLTSVADTHANTVNYNWWCDPGFDCYPNTVTYNGTTITFWRQASVRSDPVTFANGSTLGQTRYLLQTIDVQVSGSRARAYAINYTTSGSSSRSLLHTVKQYGTDATLNAQGVVTGGTSWPATTAGYRAGSTGFNEWNWSSGTTYGSGFDALVADFNGDGKTDLFVYGLGSQCNPACPVGVYMGLSTGSGFTEWTWSQPSTDWSGYFIQTADFNGDGKADIFLQGMGQYCQTGTCPTGVYMGLSTGTGFTEWTWSQPSTDWSGYNIFLRDFNGDGSADMLLQGCGSGQCMPAGPIGQYMALSTGTGFTEWTWSQPSADWSGYNMQFADVNGDGKADMFLQGMGIYCSSGACPVGQYMALSAGTGFTEWTWSQGSTDWSQYNILFADFDGDGSSDMYLQGAGNMCSPACAIGQYMGLSTGSGFTEWTWSQPSTDWSNWDILFGDFNGDKRADLYLHAWAAGNWDYYGQSTGAGFTQWTWNTGADWSAAFDPFLADYNGDQKSDLLIGQPVGSQWVEDLGLANGVAPDLLTSIGHPLGSTTTVGYKPSSAWSNTYLPFNTQTVSSYAVADGRGNTSTTTYSYSGGLYDPIDRRFLGFHHEKDSLPCNPEDHGSCPFTDTWFHQDYGSRSKPDHVNRSTGAGTLLASTVYQYTTNGATQPYTSLETGVFQYTYDGTGGTQCPGVNCKRTYSTKSYDAASNYAGNPGAYGNVTQLVQYGDFDVSGDEVTYSYFYSPNTGAYIVSAAGDQQAFAGVGTTGTRMAENQTYYDGSSAWSTAPTVGNATETLQWVNTNNSWITQKSTFDSFGNALTVTDGMNNTTTMTWDATYHEYCATWTNALNQVVSTRVWNGVCGEKTSDTGPNGASDVVTITYDALCRPTKWTFALGYFIQYSYQNFGSPTTQYLEVDTPPADGTQTNQWTRNYVDGRRRTYQKTQKGPATINQVMAYNPRGQMASQTDPYYSGGSPNTTTTTYDALDRPLVITNPDNTTVTMSYVVWSTTATDELGHPRTTMRNAYGNKAADKYVINGTQFQTSYAYDALQRLTGITDANGNAWVYTYDSLGRRLSANDPDLGVWTTIYDADSRVASHTDAKNQTVTFGYDAISRKTSETMTNPPVTYTWTYDQVRSGYSNVGHMTSQTEPTGGATYNYDLLGRNVQMTKTIDGTPYTFAYGYDAGGRIKFTTYPDGDTLGTSANPLTYDAAGRAYAIPGVVSSTTYTAYGAPNVQTNANGTTATYAYNSRHLMTTLGTVHGSTTIQNLGFTRDADGKITTITSPFADEGWNPISYDTIDRLTSATNTSSSALNQTFTYDAVNNILSNSQVGTYTYPTQGAGSSHPHAVTKAGSTSYTYDANGSMSAKGSTTYGWDGENRLASVGSTTFVYDAGDKRVKKLGNATNVYVTPDYKVAGGTATKEIKLGRLQVAVRIGTTNTWVHPDQVGSVQVLTDSSGNVYNRFYHRPFGDRYQTSNSNLNDDVDFVGQRRDIETGLIYYPARYYDPVLGRFIAADPSEPGDPRVGVNRYAYALNDPIDLVDDGHDTTLSFSIPRFSVPTPFGLIGVSGLSVGYNFTTGAVSASGTYYQNGLAAGFSLADAPGGQYTLSVFGGVGANGVGFAGVYGSYNFSTGQFDAGVRVTAGDPTRSDLVNNPSSNFGNLTYTKSFKDMLNQNCFAAGTLVRTERGLVPIEQVKVGDRVWSRDERTGEEGFESVLQTFVTPDKPTIRLDVRTGDRVEMLEVTPNHPFWVDGHGWVAASQLLGSDPIVLEAGLTSGFLVQGMSNARTTTVYNFEVEGFHSYFVGEAGIWVHNDSDLQNNQENQNGQNDTNPDNNNNDNNPSDNPNNSSDNNPSTDDNNLNNNNVDDNSGNNLDSSLQDVSGNDESAAGGNESGCASGTGCGQGSCGSGSMSCGNGTGCGSGTNTSCGSGTSTSCGSAASCGSGTSCGSGVSCGGGGCGAGCGGGGCGCGF
jgi:RHS repeat-associated protein